MIFKDIGEDYTLAVIEKAILIALLPKKDSSNLKCLKCDADISKSDNFCRCCGTRIDKGD